MNLVACKLSEEQFQSVTASLGVIAAGLGKERGRDARVALSKGATIIPCEGKDRRPFSVVVLNMSRTGLAIKDGPLLPRGTQFILRLPPHDGTPIPALLCTVIYASWGVDGSPVTGAQFSRVISAPKASLQPATTLQT
jgi:hypothetical protein